MKIQWPEKKKFFTKDGCQNCVTNYNEAIDACKEAYAKSIVMSKVSEVKLVEALMSLISLVDTCPILLNSQRVILKEAKSTLDEYRADHGKGKS